MEFVSVRDLKIHTADVWEKLAEERDLIITSNGRPVALMTDIAGNNLETILGAVRRARGEWAIRQMRKSAHERGLDKIPEKEIEEEIRKSRRERHR